MAYQVLARKYRPQRFSDVVGQDHVTRTLLNALAQGRIAHGYIFSGHRGIGKTTIARILAAALNCSTPVGSPERPSEEPCQVCVNCREISSASRQENPLFEESHSFDVEEIDAATNRGIDDARLLTAKIQTRPTNKSRYRIIILDEAHQITDAAWNALLKTLEEPPEWAVFMFATTQPEDIPQTIRSRCQHFSFHAVKLDDIVGQLRLIAEKEGILTDDATLTLLAEAGDGSMRDALSIMDQAIASAPLESGRPHLAAEQVRELMGSVSTAVYEQILAAVNANASAEVLAVLGRLLDAGNGAAPLARQFVRYLRNTVVAKVTGLAPDAPATGVAADLLQISPEERQRVARSAALFSEEELSRFLSIMLRTFDELGYRQEQRFHLELGVLKLVHVQRLVPVEELLSLLGTAPAAKALPVSRPAGSGRAVGGATAASGSAATPARPSPAVAVPSPVAARGVSAESSAAQRPETEGALALAPRPEPTPGLQLVPGPAMPLSAAIPEPEAARPQPEAAEPAPKGVQPALKAPETEFTAAPTELKSSVPDLTAVQQALSAALAARGHQSAAEQMEEATLTLHGETLEVQTSLSAAMLAATFNAEAERLLQAALRTVYGGTLRLKLLPGQVRSAAAVKRPARAAAAGSAAELAERHPMVQEAKRLFSAEISSVIDLRGKE